MKAEYINPFLKSSANLFKDYLGLKIEAGKPYINAKPQNLEEEVSGIIGLAGEVVGAVTLCFKRETALKIVSVFCRKSFRVLSNEAINGVGELVNIIAGNAKQYMEQYRINISLPGVIVGKSYQINWPKGVPIISIPFTSEMGDFTVNVSFK
jgi:chemotaxis protein CheX